MGKLEAQTVIARHKCPDCGGRVFVKVNKNGNAYFNCNHEVEETGNKCAGQRRYGRDVSAGFVARYVANGNEVFDMEAKPAPRPEPKPVAAKRQTLPPKEEMGLQVGPKTDDVGDFLNGI